MEFPTVTITEGNVKLIVPNVALQGSHTVGIRPLKAPVFYNPAMTLSRDLAVLTLRVYARILGRRVTLCDALTGCGVRGLRLAVEVDGVDRVVANDINPLAVKLARINAEINGVGEKVSVENRDARLLLLNCSFSEKRFDYVDIDPFGSPAPFLQAAAFAVRDGGILAVTATDTATLCGLYPRTCFRKYWAWPLKTEYHSEVATRLLVGFIARTLAMQGMGAEPLLTYREAHYVRAYVLTHRGVRYVDETLRNIGHLHHCFHCLNRELSHGFVWDERTPCKSCGQAMASAGPLWIGKLLKKPFCERLYEEAQASAFNGKKPLLRLIGTLVNEAEGAPTYFIPARICKKLGTEVPPTRLFMARLKQMDYSFTRTHYAADGFKTDAPASVVVEAVKAT